MIKRSKTLTKAATAATANKSTLHVMKPHPKQDRQSTRKKPGKKKNINLGNQSMLSESPKLSTIKSVNPKKKPSTR